MTILISPQIRDFAERILAGEAAVEAASANGTPSIIRSCEKLRRPLSMLAGSAGFHSVLSRSLTLARREAPGLGALRVGTDGLLERVEPDRSTDDVGGGVLLLAHMISLLFSFIGETLTLRLIHDVWPGILFSVHGSKNQELIGRRGLVMTSKQ